MTRLEYAGLVLVCKHRRDIAAEAAAEREPLLPDRIDGESFLSRLSASCRHIPDADLFYLLRGPARQNLSDRPRRSRLADRMDRAPRGARAGRALLTPPGAEGGLR